MVPGLAPTARPYPPFQLPIIRQDLRAGGFAGSPCSAQPGPRCPPRTGVVRVDLSRVVGRVTRAVVRHGRSGVGAYARALVASDEDDFREAVAHLEASPLAPYLARTQLLHGEWLRRQGRRRDARRHLRTAHELFTTSAWPPSPAAPPANCARPGTTSAAKRRATRTGSPARRRTSSAGRGRRDVQGGRGTPVLVPHRRGPPAQHLSQARHHLAPTTPRPADATRFSHHDLTVATRHRWPAEVGLAALLAKVTTSA